MSEDESMAVMAENMAAGRQAAAGAVAKNFHPDLQVGGSRVWTWHGLLKLPSPPQ